jgi:hypothetical protein
MDWNRIYGSAFPTSWVKILWDVFKYKKFGQHRAAAYAHVSANSEALA